MPADSTASRPSIRDISAVWVGGLVGSALRVVLTDWVGAGSWPVGTLAVNLTGSALLGWLIVTDHAPRQRLLWGVGFLGSFTTFSAFAVEATSLSLMSGLLYLSASVAGGLLSAWVGMRAARR